MRFIPLFLLLFASSLVAQELDCNVRVQTTQVTLADPAIFENLETDIYEFMNNRRWTKDEYTEAEKIVCNFNINIVEEISSTRFRAEVIINASRPVYNSSYTTQIFRHQDNEIEFNYAPFTPLEYDPNAFLSNLTHVLAFYANIILAMDYDSFSEEGGTPYLTKAKQLVDLAQNSGFPGWITKKNVERNRYRLIDDLMNNRFIGIRRAYYQYHRQGLDLMFDDTNKGRSNIVAALEMVGEVNKNNPNTMLPRVFSNTKSEEIINIFKDASVNGREKAQVLSILSNLDPAASRKLSTQSAASRQGTNTSRTTTPTNTRSQIRKP